MTDFDFSDLLAAPTPIGIDQISVLECTKGVATKTIYPDKIQGFHANKFYNLEQQSVNGIKDLYGLLGRLERDPRRFIIRGKPVGQERKSIRRRSLGDDATFRDDPCHWACFDIDSQGTAGGTPLDAIKDLLRQIPQLEGVTVIAQLSSSWGIKPGIRAHLWVWLDEARNSGQVQQWASSFPVPVDRSLYNPVQPHYTAAPIFKGGKTDPLDSAGRLFLIPGNTSDSVYIPAGDAAEELTHWIESILRLGETGSERHPLHNRAAYSLGGWVGAGVLEQSDVEERLIDACAESGAYEPSRLDTARDEISRALADGMRSPRKTDDWKNNLLRNEDGAIKLLPANYISIFLNHPNLKGKLGFDVREFKTLFTAPPPWGREGQTYPREMTDEDDTEACGWANRIGVHTAAAGQISAALSAAARYTEIDRVVQWLGGLDQWDGVERLDTWLPKTTGCPNDVYHRAVSTKFILSLVARAMQPGCKSDNMVVFVGEQGVFKSTLLSAIVGGPGPWAFSDCLGDIKKPQDYIPSLMGPWLIEVAELATFSKREVDVVKKFLSTQSDRSRLSYGRRAVDIPRRCVIAGTSNPAEFLSDPTGNRRFWPVDVVKICIDAFVSNRDQIFAEALAKYRGGAKWHLEGDEIEAAKSAQEDHMMLDPWEESIARYLDTPPVNLDPAAKKAARKTEVKMLDVLIDGLEIPTGQCSAAYQRRVGVALKRLGWVKHRVRNGAGREMVYRRGQ